MGRYYYSKKEEADDLKKISASWLHKHKYFNGWMSGIITWTNGYSGNKSEIEVTVSTHSNDMYMRLTKVVWFF